MSNTGAGRPSRTRPSTNSNIPSAVKASTAAPARPMAPSRQPSIDPPTTAKKGNTPWTTTATETPTAKHSRLPWNGGGSTSKLFAPQSLLSKRSNSSLNSDNNRVPATPTGAGRQLSIPVSERARKSSLASISSASTVALGDVALAKGEVRHVEGYDPDKEPIKTYLRIRPPPAGANAANYIKVLNETEVAMIPPANHRLNTSNTYSSLVNDPLLRSQSQALDDSTSSSSLPTSPAFGGSVYKFTQVFSPSASPPTTPTSPSSSSQSSFFRATTLPLVVDFLRGQNCLLFAYGPTGSGKTWTVQGGDGGAEESGLLPRVLDVVWRSLEGMKSGSNFRPTGLGSVHVSPPTPDARKVPQSSTPNKGATGLGIRQSIIDEAMRKNFEKNMSAEEEIETIPVDDGYEYSIWVSYAEIYNEKIYDLLESPLPSPSPSASSAHSATNVFSAGFGLLSGKVGKAMGIKSFQTVKRNALSLKHDKDGVNKYVSGMKEVRIHSSEEARGILDKGQLNRRVFSTLANRASSRSHSIFTIKVLKIRKGADPDDTSAATTSRFSIVDLAGSERVVNSGTTGERLKEAGNINKSLMVLGQCMETLRRNQEKVPGRKPALVPFRHSKLTEIFQSFFVGDGKAVMIVNVNPYETGFDENSHVMKFSAVAKGVMTLQDKTPRVIAPVAPLPVTPKEVRVVRLSMIEGGEEEDFVYEEEDADEEEAEEEDQFVNALLDEITFLRKALRDQNIETIMAASKAKASTVREYELKLLETERHYQNLMREEVGSPFLSRDLRCRTEARSAPQALEAEVKLNAKLDILSRHQNQPKQATPGTPGTPSTYDDSDEEELELDEEDDSVEIQEGEEEEVEEEPSTESEGDASGEVEKMLLDEGDLSMRSLIEDSPSAQAGKRTHKRTASMDSPQSNKLATSKLHKSFVPEEAEEEDEDDEEEVPLNDDDAFSEPEEEEESEEEYVPAPRKSNVRASRQSTATAKKSPPKVIVEVEVEVKPKRKGKASSAKAALSESTNSITEVDEDDGSALDKSMVIGASGKKKTKRKLGGAKVKDIEDIDSIADSYTPIIVKSSSTRSNLSQAGSLRSLKY